MNRPPPSWVSGDEALAIFRQGLTGRYALDLLREADGRLLIQLPVGVGKTEWLVRIIRHVVVTRRFDLVIALFPRRDIIDEFTLRLPPDVDRIVVRPRPKERCGSLNAPWERYEASNCGLLGRQELCESCHRRVGCFWPDQFGDRLRHAPVVIATQRHVEIDPGFVDRITSCTGAANPLVLQDESNLLLKSTMQVIDRDSLVRFSDAVEAVPGPASIRWGQYLGTLLRAGPDDMGGNWKCPTIAANWARQVQQSGWQIHGDRFQFLGHSLKQFGQSRQSSRELMPDASIRFSSGPSLGKNFVVFTGSMAPRLARYRLDPEFECRPVLSPMSHFRFRHPETRWFNVSNLHGAAKWFRKNSPAILDFFAGLVTRNIRDGRRTLLICKKRFAAFCSSQIGTRVASLGVNCRVVATNWHVEDYDDPATVPLIHYGVSGLNLFEDFDAAYALTGFYVSDRVLTEAVHDFDRSTDRHVVGIKTVGKPPRRVAEVAAEGQNSILPAIAQESLDQLEADVIVQAVGRVRPMTRPREVITFHAGQLPGVEFEVNFANLKEARSYFGLKTSRRRQCEQRRERAMQLRASGVAVSAIAAEIGVSDRTVRRYLAGGNRS